MPIYEYQCQECGHKLEVMQRMSDERLKTCPDCAKDTLIKLISTVAFQLKGTGWYETDFKNNGKPKDKGAADKDGGDTAKGSGSDDKGSEGASKSADNAAKTGASDSKPSEPASGAKTEKRAPQPSSKPAAE